MENVVCEFCGQSLMCDQELSTEAEQRDYARQNCTCDTARAYAEITRLFGRETETHCALEGRVLEWLYAGADLIRILTLEEIKFKVNSELKGAISMTSKEKLRIFREDKETAQAEV